MYIFSRLTTNTCDTAGLLLLLVTALHEVVHASPKVLVIRDASDRLVCSTRTPVLGIRLCKNQTHPLEPAGVTMAKSAAILPDCREKHSRTQKLSTDKFKKT